MIAVKQVEVDPHPSRRERESIEALKFESYTLRDLDHPNIVQFLGFEESPERLSMCVRPLLVHFFKDLMDCSFMEYVAGGTIGSCLKAHGKFHDEVTKSFTRQVLEGTARKYGKCPSKLTSLLIRTGISAFEESYSSGELRRLFCDSAN